MIRTAFAGLGVLLLWAAVGGVAVFAVSTTNMRWPAEVSFLVVAAAVVAAWGGSDVLLRRLGRQLPYRPE